MKARTALAATLAIGMVGGPAVTMGALVAPAVAQGGHGSHRHHHHGTGGFTRADGHSSTSATGDTDAGTPELRTFHGVVVGTPTATTLVITRSRHGSHNCLTTPKTLTLTLDSSTTFSTTSSSTASYADLSAGDAVTVTMTAPDGAPPTGIPVTSVADAGAAPAVRCEIRGLATTVGTPGGVNVQVVFGEHGHHHRHGHGRNGHRTTSRRNVNLHRAFVTTQTVPQPLAVTFDSNTTFVDPGNPAATLAQIMPGDRLTIVWMLPPGTPPGTTPAVEVVDHGPPTPIRYFAEGTAAAGGSLTGVGLTVNHLFPNMDRQFADGSVLPVLFDTNTTFVDVGSPGATIDTIAQGDTLIVVWTAPRHTPAINRPAAARVIDLGQAPAQQPGV
jgi:hypothetical protein